jgi:hypothetical protein
MEALSRENEKTVAIGNMKVNAKGDQLGKGASVTKTADQIARENHRIQSAIVNTGLKGKPPAVEGISLDKPVTQTKVTKAQAPAPTKKKEVELPSGDIVIEDDSSSN